jgi:hypothetical protein
VEAALFFELVLELVWRAIEADFALGAPGAAVFEPPVSILAV